MSVTASGARRTWVTVQQPGTPVPDGGGSFTTTWVDAVPPTWQVAITSAAGSALERAAAGTTITTATHVIRGPYRPDITTATQLVAGARTFQVDGVRDVDERHRELEVIGREVQA